jgi:hypothetical protein
MTHVIRPQPRSTDRPRPSSSKFSANKLPQAPPKVCKKAPPKPAPIGAWPADRLQVLAAWSYNPPSGGGTSNTQLFSLTRQPGTDTWHGLSDPLPPQFDVLLNFDRTTSSADVDLLFTESGFTTYNASWNNIPLADTRQLDTHVRSSIQQGGLFTLTLRITT